MIERLRAVQVKNETAKEFYSYYVFVIYRTVFHTLSYSTKVAATPHPERKLFYLPSVRSWSKYEVQVVRLSVSFGEIAWLQCLLEHLTYNQ